MNYARRILSNPAFYYIPLPQKSRDIFLEVNLKTGYAEENDCEFGLGHLLEHYIIGELLKKCKKGSIKTNATISKNTTNYYLKSTKSKLLKESKIFLESVLNPNFSDDILFRQEKESIINELNSKLNSIYERGIDFVFSERFEGQSRSMFYLWCLKQKQMRLIRQPLSLMGSRAN